MSLYSKVEKTRKNQLQLSAEVKSSGHVELYCLDSNSISTTH